MTHENGNGASVINWILSSSNLYDYVTETVVTDLSNCELLIFAGCKTGDGERNLPHAAMKSGATYAIGFKSSVDCNDTNEWTVKFFEYFNTLIR